MIARPPRAMAALLIALAAALAPARAQTAVDIANDLSGKIVSSGKIYGLTGLNLIPDSIRIQVGTVTLTGTGAPKAQTSVAQEVNLTNCGSKAVFGPPQDLSVQYAHSVSASYSNSVTNGHSTSFGLSFEGISASTGFSSSVSKTNSGSSDTTITTTTVLHTIGDSIPARSVVPMDMQVIQMTQTQDFSVAVIADSPGYPPSWIAAIPPASQILSVADRTYTLRGTITNSYTSSATVRAYDPRPATAADCPAAPSGAQAMLVSKGLMVRTMPYHVPHKGAGKVLATWQR